MLPPAKKVPLNRVYPPDLQTHFVVNFVAQHQADHFILSFFEVFPPAILAETEEEKQKKIEEVTSVDARCVARLVVTPEKMQEFIAVMRENYEIWQHMMDQITENEGSDK